MTKQQLKQKIRDDPKELTAVDFSEISKLGIDYFYEQGVALAKKVFYSDNEAYKKHVMCHFDLFMLVAQEGYSQAKQGFFDTLNALEILGA